MLRVPLLPIFVYMRAMTGVRRLLDRGDRFAGAFMGMALTADEKLALGIRMYDVGTTFHRSELFPWEQTWLARRLPPAPARILVGACGAGREVMALTAGGYQVDAFEPASQLLRLARERCADKARVLDFRYEDLSAAVLDGARNASSPFAGERYDAVLLGWGSFTHVLDERERKRLLQALVRLCPRGPLLASFWCDWSGANAEAPRGRLERYGAACGRVLASLRGIAVAPSPGELFALPIGFAYRFTKDEIEALAASVGRKVTWEDDGTDYPHVTFL